MSTAPYVALLSSGPERPKRIRPLSPNESLRSIALSALQVGKVHRGCAVYGTLCVEPFRTTAIQTVLADAAGNAVLLSIYDKEHVDFKTKYFKGRMVAINEPYFKMNNDDSVGIRVDDPADVAVQVVAAAEGTTSTTDAPDVGKNMADFLRTLGNRCFASEDWSGAVDYYTKSIDHAERRRSSQDPNSVGSPGGDEASVEESTQSSQLLLAYSNRSQAYLKLEDYENALSDALQALGLNSAHEKSVVRKGRALIGLKRFGEAVSCLEEFLTSNTSVITQRAAIEDIIKTAKTADEDESEGG